MSIFDHLHSRYDAQRKEDITLDEYLTFSESDPEAYVSSAERLLKSIGKPILIDTSKYSRMNRTFSSKVSKLYLVFK
ncbi:hypothetical protein O1D97_03825 [Marinomonas sp. 15G1-11]|uniref:PrkA AAA domain-containing protein n=1 Tax=Marinomonas phaeophyticola TaxID=3004091 RepID=A0ABT4JR27_9GAMM|nr:hypothetical protein [Marinomonas sp. 15G1-11]MCZ2720793.1 hypothetical protein [Marinomonas sp. 15G1-11]